MSPRRVLIVTNDFPPRQGGIQSFVYELASRLPAHDVAVYCSAHPGSAEFDAQLDFPVWRHPTGLLIPTPGARRRVLAAAAEFGTTAVWFGAAAPLALLTPALRAAGVRRAVATTHGHEVGWAKLPLARQALRRIGNSVDVVTYLGEYTRRRLAGAFGPQAQLVQLTPGVDSKLFHPDADGRAVRSRYGLAGRPVIVCVSRLVPRKGQDTLIKALPVIREQVPGAALLLVGKGPYEKELRALARQHGVAEDVVFAGGVDHAELPAHFAAGDVFAMPCRTRRFGMDVEGLGIVFLEASATGLPVVAGDSGGAPDAVLAGRTGSVVDGTDVRAVAGELVTLLQDRQLETRLGQAGREWVENNWQWDSIADRLAGLLQL
ncbi:MAG: phosphatidyl-myo-inositol dimannoside synthase [Pseudonocardiales bacterium]|jgi:phosphatidylinositol alpha-1,6-mannosyltransferase|nr:phosphatidyl-myo-inositol dimannoside synthase [Pseudonocardiales bacterium]